MTSIDIGEFMAFLSSPTYHKPSSTRLTRLRDDDGHEYNTDSTQVEKIAQIAHAAFRPAHHP